MYSTSNLSIKPPAHRTSSTTMSTSKGTRGRPPLILDSRQTREAIVALEKGRKKPTLTDRSGQAKQINIGQYFIGRDPDTQQQVLEKDGKRVVPCDDVGDIFLKDVAMKHFLSAPFVVNEGIIIHLLHDSYFLFPPTAGRLPDIVTSAAKEVATQRRAPVVSAGYDGVNRQLFADDDGAGAGARGAGGAGGAGMMVQYQHQHGGAATGGGRGGGLKTTGLDDDGAGAGARGGGGGGGGAGMMTQYQHQHGGAATGGGRGGLGGGMKTTGLDDDGAGTGARGAGGGGGFTVAMTPHGRGGGGGGGHADAVANANGGGTCHIIPFMSPEQKVAIEEAEAAKERYRKERIDAEAVAARERKMCASAVHALADKVEAMGTTVNQHTGQIGALQGGQKDLQEGQELHASQIGDLQGAVKKLEIQGQTSAQVAADTIQHQAQLKRYVDTSQSLLQTELKNYVDERLGLSPNENK